MMYPVLIQVISWTVAPSDPIMWGSATATIDESIAPMRVPNVIDTVTSHLLGLGRMPTSRGVTEEAKRAGAAEVVAIMFQRVRCYRGAVRSAVLVLARVVHRSPTPRTFQL